jgi:signal transduction histidine kinase
MTVRSLRFRLIAAYAGLIVLGFGGLALLAGRQISAAARHDFERRLASEVILIARGLTETARAQADDELTEDMLSEVLDSLSARPDTRFRLILFSPGRDPIAERGQRLRQGMMMMADQHWPLPEHLRAYQELVAASRDAVLVTRRNDETGRRTLFTAAPVTDGSLLIGYLQLSVPESVLRQAVRERWRGLALAVLAITTAALVASIWLSTSLIRPLEKLRDSAIRFSRGELSHRVAAEGHDEIAAVARAFNQMAERVQAMIEEQRSFASNTSHELRTPLTTMRLRTEALRQESALDPATRQQYIRELDEELAHLSKLIEDLILLSRFDAGRAELGSEQIDLARFAQSLLQSLSGQATERGIALALDVAVREPLPISASLTHLTVVFRNLLDNALKYTPPGGQVVWRITLDGQDALSTISDTGQGIAPEHLGRVFERFYRADRSRSRAIPGTGLGLALARSVVETYGGQIAISSPGLGQGTTITVRWKTVGLPS